MHKNFKENSADKEIVQAYHKYIVNFICEKLLIILGKTAIIGAVTFLIYLILLFIEVDRSVLFESIIIPLIVYTVIIILRIKKNYPTNAFLAFNFNEKFQELATEQIADEAIKIGSHHWAADNDDELNGYKTIFNILKAPGDALGDIICLIIQIIKVLIISKRYKNFMIILVQTNGDAITGGEIFSNLVDNKLLINELKCQDIINEMLSFEWIIVGRDGYKMSTAMRRNLDKNYQDDPIF